MRTRSIVTTEVTSQDAPTTDSIPDLSEVIPGNLFMLLN